MTPCPASAMPRAMAPSSGAVACSDGVGSPRAVRWLRVREVEKPIAPARMASAVSRRMAAASESVAASRRVARSPITYRRIAPWGSWAQTSMSWGRASTESRYSGKVSQDQSSPSWSAAPGMSSTPSMSSTSWSSPPARTGANPTPQLPITAVVTPCQLEGAREPSQVTWPS